MGYRWVIKKEYNQREIWVDCLKGFAILCVMWCHAQYKETFIYNWVHTIQIPLFLIATGYLFELQNKSISSMRKTLTKIIIPYISFSFIAIAVDFIFCILLKQSYSELMVIDAYKTITFYGIGPLWYLPSYIVGCYIALVIRNKQEEKTNVGEIIIAASLIYVSIAAGAMLDLIRWGGGSASDYWKLYFPVCSLLRGTSCAVFIIIGTWLYRIHKKLKPSIIIIIVLVSLIVSLLLVKFCSDTNFSTMSYGKYPVFFFGCSFFGALGVSLIFYLIRQSMPALERVLTYCGVNSMVLLGTHMSLKLPDITYKLFEISGIDMMSFSSVIGFLCFSIMLIVEILIVYIVRRKPINKIFGG